VGHHVYAYSSELNFCMANLDGQHRLPYLNSNLTTLQRSIVLCINGVDSPQISSSVFDTILPARFILYHVISSLFMNDTSHTENFRGKHICVHLVLAV